MSQYEPKNQQTQLQALRVQDLAVSGADAGLYSISGGNTFVFINEPVEKVFVASVKVDGTNSFTEFAQANISVVDTVSLTTAAPSNRGAIKLTGLAALAANDVILVRYSVQSR